VRRRNQRGQTTLLIVGFFLVVALVVGVAVDASAAYLQRQGLASLADGAALAAADGVRAEQAYAGSVDDSSPVDVAVARRYAEEYLRQVGARQRFAAVRSSVTASGSSVVVRLSAPVRLPIAPPDWEDAPRITGVAAAYVLVGE
jgi:uncharacterized membrane protein